MEKFPQHLEREVISDERCIEAMQSGDIETVRAWYAEQEQVAEQDPTSKGHMRLTLHMAELQVRAGLLDYAKDTLKAAYEDAYHQGNDALAKEIAERLAEFPDES